MPVSPVPPRRDLLGHEPFIGLDASVADFWRFALADLRTNTVRGLVAEFLVARAVGSTAGRIEWDPFDVLSPSGVRIEVKSAAYLQSWEQKTLSRIAFSGLRARRLDPVANDYVGEPDYNADVYVFSVQTADDHASYDVLDTTQWTFDVVPRAAVASTECKSLGLRTVRSLSGGSVAYEDLAAAIAAATPIPL
jgi:hypothetical protein